MFRGTGTALITPFTQDNQVDYTALDALIEKQIASGIKCLFICGTTGEPTTMTEQEKNNLIAYSIKKINHRVPTFIGTGSNCTAHAVESSRYAQECGADGILVVTPYYNKCTQEGLYLHYKAINDAVNIPIVAYNVPGRTGVNILPETARRLTQLKNIKGLKEACGNLEQIAQTAKVLEGSEILLYSGDDGLALDVIRLGGQGLISVASNLIPEQMSTMLDCALSDNMGKALAINDFYNELFSALFYEVNPIPIKYACSAIGLCQNVLRLPLTPMSEAQAQRLEAVMRKVNII